MWRPGMMQLKTGQSRADFTERRLMYDMTSSKHFESFTLFTYIFGAHKYSTST
jgi:hypothetical protein